MGGKAPTAPRPRTGGGGQPPPARGGGEGGRRRFIRKSGNRPEPRSRRALRWEESGFEASHPETSRSVGPVLPDGSGREVTRASSSILARISLLGSTRPRGRSDGPRLRSATCFGSRRPYSTHEGRCLLDDLGRGLRRRLASLRRPRPRKRYTL